MTIMQTWHDGLSSCILCNDDEAQGLRQNIIEFLFSVQRTARGCLMLQDHYVDIGSQGPF